VIHAHSHLYFSTNLAALQRWLGGVPLAITNHGLYSQSAPEWVFDLYLKTLGRWTFNREDVKLYVVGDGPMRSELGREAGDAVEFLGQVPYEEMPAVYRAGDVLVLPSRAEGVPRTVLEAFASGVPVVSSDLKQVAPLVEESGVTVPVGDVDGFATGIEAVLVGEYGDPREVIKGSFDWAETVERMTTVLEGL
jgi:glycosyltransferase involved in cell wall biosynthesis